MSKITDAVARIANEKAAPLGYEIWSVDFVKEAGSWVLYVYIDKPDGVSLDDCEAVSKALDAPLDEIESLFPDAGYTLIVSSAGLERKLRGPDDFPRFIGSNVEIKLYKAKFGKSTHTGILKSFGDDKTVVIAAESGELEFEYSEIASARLKLVF